MAKTKDIAVKATAEQGIQLLLALEKEGLCDEVSLNLTDPDMTYVQWESLGRFLGSIDRRARWYIGDWLNFGDALYGEAAAQGVDATTGDRYNEAERVTGLDPGTLQNIASVCRKVPRRNRRSELGFWIHQEVAKLEVDEQVTWLGSAIDEGWTKNDLRQAIRDAKNPRDDGKADDAPASEPPLSLSERIEAAARLVYGQASNNSDGDFVVPASAMVQLREALGEE